MILSQSIRTYAIFLVIFYVLLLNPLPSLASDIKTDEEVTLFSTNAYLEASTKKWVIPIHGWIYEQEYDSLWRHGLTQILADKLGADDDPVSRSIFRKRAWPFLVDNERNKVLQLNIAGEIVNTTISGANGHFEALLKINKTKTPSDLYRKWLPVNLKMPDRDIRRFTGSVHLIEPSGISVISDIDDTIKISNVLDKKALMVNTFTKPFIEVPGMAKVYQLWEQQGAVFHYVSSSPWQLYSPLRMFMTDANFPQGSFHLKFIRLKDKTLFNIFKSSVETKPPIIRSILKKYPLRQFILVGDSGEKDPEVYGIIAREFPSQIAHIYIRDVAEHLQNNKQRFSHAFHSLAKNLWTVFKDPLKLSQFRLP